MSGGQQQRVAIARAIVGDRRLILADEPTGALDTDTGEEILRLLRARCDAGAAGVLVTHEARHAAWADRVVFLRDGVVVDETGADQAETLLDAGATPMSRGLAPGAAHGLARRAARPGPQRPRAGDDRAAGAGRDAPPPWSSRPPRSTGVEGARPPAWAPPTRGSAPRAAARSSRRPTPRTWHVGSAAGTSTRRCPTDGEVAARWPRRRLADAADAARPRSGSDDRRDRRPSHRGRPARPAGRRPLRPRDRRLPAQAPARWSSTTRCSPRGFALGDTLEVHGDDAHRSSASAATPTDPRRPMVLGPLGDLRPRLAASGARDWLVDGGPVPWSTGARRSTSSAALVTRGPCSPTRRRRRDGRADGLRHRLRRATSRSSSLIVVMALLEVVLLAGPAFAVGARRQARTLALMAASRRHAAPGAPRRPGQRRRARSGRCRVGARARRHSSGWALLPVVQRFNGEWFGPSSVRWLLPRRDRRLRPARPRSWPRSCPAWLASRQDVVAVLAGRRGDRRRGAARRSSAWSCSASASRRPSYGAAPPTKAVASSRSRFGAIVSVFGMILIVPVVVSVVGTARRGGCRW